MEKNGKSGAIRQRTQTKSGHWIKRDSTTGQFMNVKSGGEPSQGVRKEK